MALRALGRESEATQLFGTMRKLADEQMNTDVKIDYFATSLPNFLIFEDDLEKRNRADGLFLRGLARIGLGENVEGIADLSSARELDPNHLGVQFELNLAPEIAAALTPERRQGWESTHDTSHRPSPTPPLRPLTTSNTSGSFRP